jgi:hypothetical protein
MAKARFRVAINGFTCHNETWDDALNFDGQHDEVYFVVNTKRVGNDGTVLQSSDSQSMTMGDVRGLAGRIQVGSARDWLGSQTGGIISGDSYPSPTPYLRNVDLATKEQSDPRLYPPYKVWEQELSDSATDVYFLTPTLWEWDPGQGALDCWVDWQKTTDARFGERAKEIYGRIWPVAKPVFDAVSLGIQTFATLPGLWSPLGRSMNRPIGLQRDPANPDGSVFNPMVIALTYQTADFLANSDLSGLGKGVIAIRYADDPFLRGAYTIYLQVDRVGGSAEFQDGSVVREVSRPEVYVIFGGAKFWIPDPATLQRLYGGWAAVRVVPDGTLAADGIGDVPADGTIVREEHAPEVWRIESGTRRWIVSPTVLARYGGWAAVRLVPDSALAKFPTGAPLTA